MRNTAIEYKIDNCNALITKEGTMYKVDTTSPTLPYEYCNDSLVSNVNFFKTIKECKNWVDFLSTKHD